jgi:FXSXX-COOH protein
MGGAGNGDTRGEPASGRIRAYTDERLAMERPERPERRPGRRDRPGRPEGPEGMDPLERLDDRAPEPPEPPEQPGPQPAGRGPAGGAYEPALDLAGMDLDRLATVDHPVLSALVGDLRARVAGTNGAGLWGFDNDSPTPPPPPPSPPRPR